MRRWLVPVGLSLLPVLGAASACLDRPIGAPPPVTTNILVDKITQTSVDKIDLLFMIDNSISMSDKQEILQRAVPDLVSRLVNPICVDGAGNQTTQPGQGETCLDRGETPEFNPINDINIGVVSSSLGDVGANAACPSITTSSRYLADRVDMAHLMGSLERNSVPRNRENAPLQPEGFLAWRAGSTNLDDFNTDFATMVRDVGEYGCGWEASLESWYRFLVDPAPYEQLVRVVCPDSSSTVANCVQLATNDDNSVRLDNTLLQQRARFLRPDSLVAIIMLTDENDCSMRVGGQSWVVAAIDDTRPMFKGTTACEPNPADPNNTGPNAKCCHSCAVDPPAGCAPDPACDIENPPDILANRLARIDDGQNLRCFQQKRRFGLDLLYPTRRYVNALTQFQLCWSAADLSTDGCRPEDIRPNPLYEGGRLPSLVFLGGIVGVPWQAIASPLDANGDDIPNFLDPSSPAAPLLRFKNFEELSANDGDGTTWDEILGDPGVPWRAASGNRPEVAALAATPPRLVQMVESEYPRPGVTPGNPINGREYDTTKGEASQGAADDLQYACIFPLSPPRDCTTRDPNSGDACDCFQGDLDRPLCEQQPGTGTPGTTQYWSKAYPGGRHLEVLKNYGANSIVASICARNVEAEDRPDYGYRPAIAAIVDRLKEQLGNRCLPRTLTINEEDNTVSCTLVETYPQRPRNDQGVEQACPPCEARFARRVPDPKVDAVVRGQLSIEPNDPCGVDDPNCTRSCLCEVLQVQQVENQDAEALRRCQFDTEVTGVEGWCYIDADQEVGSPALVEDCPDTEQRLLRFVGQGLQPNTTTFVACTGSSFAARE